MAERSTSTRTPRRRSVTPRAPKQRPAGVNLRHATDLGILDRWIRGLDADADGATPMRVRDPYTQLLAIFRGVNIAAGALARVPFEIWDTRAGEPLLSENIKPDSPRGQLVQLFKQPNPAMTWRKFVETAIVHYHSGNAFLYKYEPSLYGVPSQIRLLMPQAVSPYREPGDDVMDLRGWLFQKSQGGAVRLAVEKVLRLEYAVNPADPHVGIGPFGPGRIATDTDYLAGTYQRATLQNGGAPGSILSFDGDEDELPREEADKLEGDWQRKFGAASSGNKVALLTGKWTYQVLGFRPKDMEFLSGRRFSLEEFARLLNLPPLYLGIYENAGLSDAGLRVQQRLLYEMNTIPLAMKLAEIINEGIIRQIDPTLEGVFNFDTVEALRDDLASKAATASVLVTAGWSNKDVNERLDMGFPEEEEVYTSAAESDPQQAQQGAAAAPVSMNGAQIQSVVDIVKAVVSGEIPRDSGVHILTATLQMSVDQAEAVIGTAGTPTTIVANPTEGVAEPAPPPPPPPADEPPAEEPPAEASPAEAPPADEQPIDDGEVANEDDVEDDGEVVDEEDDPKKAKAKRAARRGVVINLRGARRKVTASMARRAHKAFVKAEQQHEHAIENGLRKAIMGMRAGVLRRLVKLNNARVGTRAFNTRSEDDERIRLTIEQVNDLLGEVDEDALRMVLQRGIRGAYRSGTASLDEIMEAIGVPVENLTRFQEDRLPALVDGYVDKRLGSGIPTSVTDDIRDSVNDVVVNAINGGLNLKDTIDGIREVFDSSVSRARTIARTEAAIAMSSARQVAYMEQGVQTHQWMTAGDEHVREDHVRLDGVVAEVGEEFLPSLRYPGDPDCDDPGLIINCRCTTVPLSRLARSEALDEGASTPSELALDDAMGDDE